MAGKRVTVRGRCVGEGRDSIVLSSYVNTGSTKNGSEAVMLIFLNIM